MARIIERKEELIFCPECGKKLGWYDFSLGECKKCHATLEILSESDIKEEKEDEREIVWTCDYCNKEFDKKEECQEHEKKCKTKSSGVTGNIEILKERERKALEQNKGSDEKVLFCLKGKMEQVIIALNERLLVIKGGFMAGATFGCRVTSFYYKDITSIEVNTGLVNGIIEICTPSNQGNKEKDYWATGKDRDPWKVSNCIPIRKADLKYYQPYLKKIQEFIGKAKQGKSSSDTNEDMASQIQKLYDLYKSGVLSKKEFDKAKKKLTS